MGDRVRELWARFRRLSPIQRILILGMMGSVALMAGLVGTVGMIEMTSTPNFCRSCHIMRPYYETWKASAHNGIACIQCHIPPGLESEIHKKIEALNMVVGYLTRTWGDNPWAVVEDGACLRCHEKTRLMGDKVFHSARFRHTPHLLYHENGLKLRCTSCHAQVLRTEHVWVDPQVCALCHLREDAPASMGTCTTCHPIPDTVLEVRGMRFDHGRVQAYGMQCQWCHGRAGQGSGKAEGSRCLACHNRPEPVEALNDVARVHWIHTQETKIDCIACHTPVEHPPRDEALPVVILHVQGHTDSPGDLILSSMTFQEGSCGQCHTAQHRVIRDVYLGHPPLPDVAPGEPDFMARLGVDCSVCHTLEDRAPGLSCMVCHGSRFGEIFRRWEEALQEGRRRLQRAERVAPSRALRDQARRVLHVLKGAAGYHNVRYALQLYRETYETMRKQGAPVPPWTYMEGEVNLQCGACHAVVGGVRRWYRWVDPFRHQQHIQPAHALSCEDCHRRHEEKPRGEVLRPDFQCKNCHHRSSTLDCTTCHSRVPEDIVLRGVLEFPHAFHFDPEGAERFCYDCHDDVSGEVRWEICLECHDRDELEPLEVHRSSLPGARALGMLLPSSGR